MLKELDLVVLAYLDSPIHLAYLTYLKRHGYSPKHILAMTIMPSTGKNKLTKTLLGERATGLARRYVRNVIQLSKRKQIQDLMYKVQAGHNPINFMHSQSLEEFCGSVKYVVAESLEDPHLLTAVRTLESRALLFTGGGIVGPSLLEESGKVILHIHPGIVPYVKGSDGFYWSTLMRGMPGYSCFYMNSGIDTGDIIHTRSFEPVRLPSCKDENPDQLCDAILRNLDPHLRAQTFIDVVKMSEQQQVTLDQLSFYKQDPDAGQTYFFMDRRLKHIVIRSLTR